MNASEKWSSPVRTYLNFLAPVSSSSSSTLASAAERAFRRYLDCGILAHGFARLRCPRCGCERLVAFSCKGRLCPSCFGRRMADTAAFLVDQLLPEAPYRQWVLTFPWVLRFRLAVDRALFSALLATFLRTVFAWQRRRGRELGIAGGQSGAVSFVQRFGGALNLHPHVHCLLPDGLFVPRTDGDPLDFVPLPTPTTAEIEALTLKIARRLTAVIERRTDDESETAALLEAIAAALQSDLAAAVAPPLPSPQLALPEDREPKPKPLCAKVAGFSLHAAHAVAAGDRLALERLCRYGLRAPFAQGRLARRTDGRIVYHLRRPWPHAQGATALVLEPLDLLRRLAALVPAPYSHLVRYHGAFANRSRWRPRLPPPPPPPLALTPGPPASDQPHRDPEAELTPTAPLAAPAPATTMPRRRRSLPWAQLLCRVFHLDALRCPRCTSAMAVLALISDPKVLTSILRHLRLPSAPPALARADATELPLEMWDEAAPLDHDRVDDVGERPAPPASRSPSARPPPS